MTSTSLIEEKIKKFEDIYFPVGGEIVDSETIETMRLFLRQALTDILSVQKKEMIDWLENTKVDVTPVEDNVGAGMTAIQARAVHEYANGYNTALEDAIDLI